MAGGFEDPGADFDDEAHGFGGGDEFDGGDVAEVGIVPAAEGFEADEGAARDAVDGLEAEEEFAAFEGAAEVAFDGGFAVGDGANLGVEEAEAFLFVIFGVVHGGVGALEEGGGAVAVAGEGADADAGADVDVVAFENEGGAEGGEEAGGECACFRGDAAALDDGEFITADAGEEFAGGEAGAEAVGGVAEEGVAGGVAHGVIDEFEAVEVDVEEIENGGLAGLKAHFGGERFLEGAAVGQAGEGIVAGVEGELFAGEFAFGDVLTEGDDLGGVACFGDEGDADADPAFGAVFAEEAAFGDVGEAFAADDAGDGGGAVFAIVIGHEVGRAFAEHFGLAVAGHAGGGGVGEDDAAEEVHDDDGDGGTFEGVAEAFLAFAEGLRALVEQIEGGEAFEFDADEGEGEQEGDDDETDDLDEGAAHGEPDLIDFAEGGAVELLLGFADGEGGVVKGGDAAALFDFAGVLEAALESEGDDGIAHGGPGLPGALKALEADAGGEHADAAGEEADPHVGLAHEFGVVRVIGAVG